MKKSLLFLVFYWWTFTLVSQNQGLSLYYQAEACGLNYVQQSITLGKRMVKSGLPYPGIEQPAAINISGLPEGAVIQKAIFWWDVSGLDSNIILVFENPDSVISSYPAEVIGVGPDKCWLYPGTVSFRADVTNSITGNGQYIVSGLPTDTNKTGSDTDGGTLLIVYTNPFENYIGKIAIADGSLLANYSTVGYTLQISPPGVTTINAEAFMLIADLQDEGSTVKMNGSASLGIVEEFWDFERKSTAITANQSQTVFELKSLSDCSNLIAVGLYYQDSYTMATPLVTQNGDSLISTTYVENQWYLNDTVPVGTDSLYVAGLPGSYLVVGTDTLGCKKKSVPVSINCIESYLPVVSVDNRTLETDTFYVSYQWYRNDTLILLADSFSVFAADSGTYYVMITDSLGCLYQSPGVLFETKFISGIDHFGLDQSITLFPNPGAGEFQVGFQDYRKKRIIIKDVTGRIVFDDVTNKKLYRLDLSREKSGMYLMQVVDKNGFKNKKIVISK